MINKLNILAFIVCVLAGTSFGNAMEKDEDAYDPFRPGMLDNHNLYDDNADREGRIQTNQEEHNRAIIWLEQAAKRDGGNVIARNYLANKYFNDTPKSQ